MKSFLLSPSFTFTILTISSTFRFYTLISENITNCSYFFGAWSKDSVSGWHQRPAVYPGQQDTMENSSRHVILDTLLS